MCKRIAAVVAILALAWTGRAKGDQISVQNATFANPGLQYSTYTLATPGWASNNAFIFSPVVGLNVNSIPTGFQVAAAGSTIAPGSLFQALGVPAVAGKQYSLTLSIGSRLEGYASHYLVELVAGQTPIATLTGGIAKGNGSFAAFTLVGKGTGTGDLGVLLSETGAGQTLFANIQVSSGTVADAPEPASLTLFGIGTAGLIGFGWRRRMLRSV